MDHSRVVALAPTGKMPRHLASIGEPGVTRAARSTHINQGRRRAEVRAESGRGQWGEGGRDGAAGSRWGGGLRMGRREWPGTR